MLKSTQEFAKAYKELNPEQRAAVDTLDGPVMVVAGPGTGKTQTVALRIANILLKTDTEPDAILALTFTDSGARAMRTRLFEMIGVAAYYCHISTFHSFCDEIIKENPDIFTFDPTSEPLSDLEKLKIIYRLLDSAALHELRPIGAPRHFAKALLGAISDLKKEGVSPDELKELLDREEVFLKSEEAESLKKSEQLKRLKNIRKNRELLIIYREYRQILTASKRFDFDDMVASVVDAFKTDENLLRGAQERFQYFLVDEYQDTNSAQNELVLLLASFWEDKANIFVTGDPDQCLPGDTLITSDQGEVFIKDIKVGDKVMSAVGKGYTAYVPVKNIFKNRRPAKLITLTLETGQKITATHNHKMFCFIPPREQSKYWYVYLMFKKGLGWRIGTTIGLSHRLKLEADADKIIGIKQCATEPEARYFEMVYSLKYRIPTVIFKYRNNMISGELLLMLYQEFNTIENAEKLALDLGINLNEPHYQRDGTTFGKSRTKINLYMDSRSYRSKYANDGLLKSPSIEHELNIQTKNPNVLKILHDKGFKLRNQKIGKGMRLVSHDLASLHKIGKELERDLDGILDIKSSLGTNAVQHKPARIMQAGNILVGNYLPIKVGNHIEYSRVISKSEKFELLTTYDLEVYPSHNFIANGIVVHNSIMRFQGASIENQLSFIKVYPAAEIITLRVNYRSTQTILDAADSLISHNNLRISDVAPSVNPHLVAAKGTGNKVGLAVLSSGTAENIFLAEDIKKKIKSGVSPADIAVIYRKNTDSKAISDTLVKYGIDYSVQGGANVLDDPTVYNFLKIFRVIFEMRKKEDDENLFTILHYEIFGVEALDVLKISRLAADKRLNLFDVLNNPGLLDSLDLSSRVKVNETLEQLIYWQGLDANSTFSDFFAKVLNESGYLNWVLKQTDAHHRLARLNTLFDEVKKMNRFDHSLNLSGFIENLDLMQDNKLRIEQSTYGVLSDTVTLTTAHSAKGLEWEHVYMVHGIDGVWGNNKVSHQITLPEGILKNVKLVDIEKNEEERCTFYVALTRAKTCLTLTRADSYSANGSVKRTVPTMFVSELGDSYLENIVTDKIEEEAHRHIETLLRTTPKVSAGPKEHDYLRSLTDSFQLAPTSLNTYLTCAYKFKLEKLIKVPSAKKSHLAFGTAIHRALEMFYRELKEYGKPPDKQVLIREFIEALEHEVITKKDLLVRREQGIKILTAYYDLHHGNFFPPLFTERNVKAKLGDIDLKGKIDRIERISSEGKEVRVIDYKTGKGKSMGQIEGTTQDSKGDLKRQLVFYKLLIDMDYNFQNIVFGEAVLDFVEEPAEKGKDGIRQLRITDDEVSELKKTIVDAMKRIRELDFPRTTDLSVCTKCAFRDHCWPDGIPTGKPQA